jgi:hypothetical protein
VYKKGDKVRVIASRIFFISGDYLAGQEATVLQDIGQWIAVQFEQEIYAGHNCNGLGKDGHCFYFLEEQLEAVK